MFNNTGYLVVMAQVMMDGNVHVLSGCAWMTPLGMQSGLAGCLTWDRFYDIIETVYEQQDAGV